MSWRDAPLIEGSEPVRKSWRDAPLVEESSDPFNDAVKTGKVKFDMKNPSPEEYAAARKMFMEDYEPSAATPPPEPQVPAQEPPQPEAEFKPSASGALGALALMGKLGAAGLVRGATRSMSNIAGAAAPTFGVDPEDAKKTLTMGYDGVPSLPGSEMIGSFADPVTTALGIKGYGAGTAILPKERAFMRLFTGGAGAGVGGSLPEALRQASAGDIEGAKKTLGIGAGAGAVVGPALSIGAKTGAIGAELLNELGDATVAANKGLRELFGDRASEAISALRGTKPLLPGEMVTSGLAASERLPEIAVIEARARGGDQAYRFLEADKASQMARSNPLNDMAEPGRNILHQGISTPSIIDRQINRHTAPLYDAAKQQQVISTPTLSEILRGAELRRSVAAGERGFSQEQTNNVLSGNRPIPSASQPKFVPEKRVYGGVDQDGNPMPSTFEPAYTELGFTPVDELMGVKKELDQQISSLAGDTTGERVRLIQARNDLVSHMERNSPEYSEANDVFKRMVQPRTRATVAEELYGAIRTPGGEENLTGFLSRLNDPEALLKSAGAVGNKQFLEQQMLPEQMDMINKIKASALRKLQAESLPKTQGIAPGIESKATAVEKIVPPVFSSLVTALRKGLKYAGVKQQSDVQKIIDEAALTPEGLAALIDTLPPNMKQKFAEMMRSGTVNQEIIPYLTGQAASAATGEQ